MVSFIFDWIFFKLSGNRTGIKSVFNSGRIGSVTLELHALEHQKKSLYTYTFKHEYLYDQLASLGQTLCVASLGWGKVALGFWGRLEQNCDRYGNQKLPLTYNEENGVFTFS